MNYKLWSHLNDVQSLKACVMEEKSSAEFTQLPKKELLYFIVIYMSLAPQTCTESSAIFIRFDSNFDCDIL